MSTSECTKEIASSAPLYSPFDPMLCTYTTALCNYLVTACTSKDRQVLPPWQCILHPLTD